MLYRFKSQAAAEIIFLSEAGEKLLNIMGKVASPQGVITLADLPNAIQTLKEAMQTKAVMANPTSASNLSPTADGGSAHAILNFHQRLLPMIDLLEQSLAGQTDVVWGT